MWYLIDSGFRNPYYNMAVDESLMDEVRDMNTVILRFFNFKPASITIGYNQRVKPWLSELERKGVRWVRRRTGGRAVIHSNDFTYSLIFQRDNKIIGGNIINSYKKIAEAFMKAFSILGIETELERGKLNNQKGGGSHLCFSATSLAELLWNGKKIIGSAQYRDKGIILQEGTIMLKKPGSIFPVIRNMTTVKEAKSDDVSLDEFKSAVIKGFTKTYNIEFKDYKKSFRLKETLIKKYSSKQWNLYRLSI